MPITPIMLPTICHTSPVAMISIAKHIPIPNINVNAIPNV